MLAVVVIGAALVSAGVQTPAAQPIVESYAGAMISAPPAGLGLDPFYKKYADAFGIPIVSSEKVDDTALLMARDTVNYMLLKRGDVRAVMVERKSRVLVMAQSEGETDLPERRDWKKPAKTDPRLTPEGRANYDKPDGIASMTDATTGMGARAAWAATSRRARKRIYWAGRGRGTTASTSSCTSSATTSWTR